ncbi:type II secretion system minor pseudopilin GspH [Psychromonas sp. MME2]|uniref:type II secretion system minor pseudopilin GspH n=1 Tax=unclassified Psychromonas TaxID=2614957 RepID=UPI00339BDC5C
MNKKNNQQGFTLLEVMLVLLLMGMISVGVVMTIPSNLTSEQSVQWQAQRFSTLLQFAEDEAMISGVELGLLFTDNNRYQFAFYDYQSKKWLPIVSKQIQSIFSLPESIEIEYALSGSVWDEVETQDNDDFIDDTYLVDVDIGEPSVVSLNPQVYVMSSGEVTPFTLTFSAYDGEHKKETLTVSVSMSGAITFSELVKP